MTRSTPCPTGSDSIIALSRRSEGVLQHIPLQSGHPSRAIGPKFLIMQALFQLHEADAGLRRQTAIAKCRLWADPIHTKSVRVKWPARFRRSSTRRAEPMTDKSLSTWAATN